jgi:hypothetical protein
LIEEVLFSLLILFANIPASVGYTQPNTPRGEIPSHIPGDLKRQIEGLYSPKLVHRVNAVLQIGRMAEKAVPAIPLLVAMLGDSTLFESGPIYGMRTRPGREAAAVLVKIGLTTN